MDQDYDVQCNFSDQKELLVTPQYGLTIYKKEKCSETKKLWVFCLVAFFVTWSVPGNLPVGLSAALKTVEEFYLVPLDSTEVCNTGAIILPVVRNFCFMEQC